MGREWRLERQRRGRAIVRLLRTRDASRRSVTLGRITAPEGVRALAAIRELEELGTADRWLTWYDRDHRGAVRALLCEDPAGEVDRLARDWPGMRLRMYFELIYKPWRSGAVRSWPQESRVWVRILSELGDYRLREIDPWLVADYLDDLRIESGSRKGQPMAGNSKRIHRAYLLALLKRAYRLRHVEEVPDLAAFRIKGSTKRRSPPRPLSADEARRLLAASSPMYRALFGLGIGLGLRPSEIVRVRWEDIDWSARTLRVRGTKTEDAAATIPLTPVAHRHLLAWWRELEQPEDGHAFVTNLGQPYQGSTGFRHGLQLAADRAGLRRRVTPYLLRASFATLCWAQGIDRDAVRRIMRHTSGKMLDEVYARPSPAKLGERVAEFDLDDEDDT